MNVLYLYSEVMGYTMAVIKSLVADKGIKVHVVYWDEKKKTPYQLPQLAGVTYYKRSDYNLAGLQQLVTTLKPVIVYVSGRMDQDYLQTALLARKNGAKVVSGFDAQWDPSWKKKVISLASRWLYRKYFDYIWVPGPLQYEFARKLGYSKEKIIWNLLSAETSLFETIYETHRSNASFNKNFLFVGRFAEVKGIDVLVNAFLKSKKVQQHDWTLTLIGNGPLKDTIPAHKDIIVYDFLQPEQLREVTKEGGVFVLPSHHEPWGVVLHEFAVAGFPILCTSSCGSHLTFVKKDYNGFVVEAGSVSELLVAMLSMINKSTVELKEMSQRSNTIGKSITPEISSSSLISIL